MADAAHRLLDKLRTFIGDLDAEERALLAALLAPGIARAHAEDEVQGFDMVHWLPGGLPDALERAIQDREIRIEGL